MKYNNIILLLLLSPFFAIAQSADSTRSYTKEEALPKKKLGTYLVLKIGVGLPTGDFGDADPNNAQSGLAKDGLLIEAEFFQELNKSIYLSIRGSMQWNKADPDPIADQFAQLLPATVNIDVSTEPWKTSTLMAGIGTISKIDNNTALITRFLIGYSSIGSPIVNTTLSDNITTVREIVESKNAGSFAYLFGLGLQVGISNTTKFVLSADYFGANPEYENILITASNGSSTITERFSFSQEVRMINLSIGLAFAL